MTIPPTPMSAEDVLGVLIALDTAEVAASIEGGWGVDALLCRQTREHADLDLAAAREDCERAGAALAPLGYRHDPHAWPGLPARFVLRDTAGHEIDFHPLVFDGAGNGWQELAQGGWLLHPADLLWRDRMIGSTPVRCIAAELQLTFRLGYAWSPEDRHDLSLLAGAFGIPLPPGSPPV